MSDNTPRINLAETAVRMLWKCARALMDPDPSSQIAAREAASRALAIQRELRGDRTVLDEQRKDSAWPHRPCDELIGHRCVTRFLGPNEQLIPEIPVNVQPPPVSQPKPERVPRRIVSLTRFQQKDGDYTEMVVADDGTIWWRDVGPRSTSSWAFYGKPSLPPREGGEP